MNPFWHSPTYALVQRIKATGNRPGVVAEFIAAIEAWATKHAATADGRAVQAWLPHFHLRPVYTANELAPMWPALYAAIENRPVLLPVKSAARLANELDFARLPTLNGAFVNPRTGTLGKYYIVERCHYWRNRELTQAEFEREFFQ